jgi:hypothetical protein
MLFLSRTKRTLDYFTPTLIFNTPTLTLTYIILVLHVILILTLTPTLTLTLIYSNNWNLCYSDLKLYYPSPNPYLPYPNLY